MKLIVFLILAVTVAAQFQEHPCGYDPTYHGVDTIGETIEAVAKDIACAVTYPLRPVATFVKFLYRFVSASGTFAVNKLAANLMILYSAKIDGVKILEDKVVDAVRALFDRDVQFWYEFVVSFSEFMQAREKEGTLPEVKVGNLFWGLEAVGLKYQIKPPQWFSDTADTITTILDSPDFQKNIHKVLDEFVEIVPDNIVKTLKKMYGLSQEDEIMEDVEDKSTLENQSSLASFNRKALDILKLLSCRLAHDFNHPPACSYLAGVWDRFGRAVLSTGNESNTNDLTRISITDYFASDEFPSQLYLTPYTIKESDPPGLLSLSLRVEETARDSTEVSDEASGKSLSLQPTIDVLRVLNYMFSIIRQFSSNLRYLIQNLSDILRTLSRIEGAGLAPASTPASNVFSPYFKEHLPSKVNHRKRSVGNFMRIANVLQECAEFDSVLGVALKSSNYFSQSQQEKIQVGIAKFLYELTGDHEDLIDDFSKHILNHINSGKKNIKSEEVVRSYISCVEDFYGPMEKWHFLSKVNGVERLKEKLMLTFRILDEDLEKLVKILKKEELRTREAFVEDNVETALLAISDLWEAYEKAGKNQSCFGAEVCKCFNEAEQKPWLSQLIKISGLTLEVYRGIENNDWKDFPEIIKTFLNSENTCEELGKRRCTYPTFLTTVYNIIESLLPEDTLMHLFGKIL